MKQESSDFYYEAICDYIKFFLTNRSHCLLKQIQNSRSNIKVYDVTKEQATSKKFLKHMCYNELNKIYLTLPYDYLTTGERVNFKDIRNIRYELHDMTVINKLFGTSIDVFYNGMKLLQSEIRIALFDDYFVVEVPEYCKDFTKMNILKRPYVLDLYTNTNEIKIYKNQIKHGCNMNNIIVYMNKYQCTNYSYIEYDDYYLLKTPVDITDMEITFIRNLNEFGFTTFPNDHLDLRSRRGKYPIDPDGILSFRNGLFVNLNFKAVTGDIFKSSISTSYEYLIYYTYQDYPYEDNYYDDNFEWFANYEKNIMDIINSPTLLPEFINEFYLFNKEISLADYVENHYKNLNDYYTDRSFDTLDFNDELISKIYDCLFNRYEDNLIIRKTFDMGSLSSEEIENMTYYSNEETKKYNKETISFVSPMLRYKLPNTEGYHINVYIDGIRNYEYSYVDSKNGADYIYIKASKVKSNSILEFEYIRTEHDKVRTIELLGDGKNQFIINNCKQLGLISSKNDERFIRVIHRTDTNCDPAEELEDVIYDEESDILTILLKNKTYSNDFYEISNIRFTTSFKFNTRKRGSGYTISMDGFQYTDCSADNFRVFKNGRELPDFSKKIIIPRENDDDHSKVVIKLDIKYTVYELIEVEYVPNKIETAFRIGNLKEDGKVDLTKFSYNNKGKNFLCDDNQYYILNGRRVMKNHYKIWCAKGLTLHNLKSQKNFCLMMNNESIIENEMKPFYDYYGNKCRYLFSKYVVTIMMGLLTDEEKSCTDVNMDRTGELYYDLYQEFLKHNIISIGDQLPEYIAFKYAGLIDEGLDNSIMMDTTEEQLYWMPLDATQESEENLVKIMNLYYKLLDNINELVVVDPDDIPDQLYKDYKELFDNNVLVLQLPEYINTSVSGDED